MPRPRATWTTHPKEVSVGTDVDGTFSASVPLYDDGVKACTLEFTITADRVLTVLCVNEPGTAGLQGFRAWSKEA